MIPTSGDCSAVMATCGGVQYKRCRKTTDPQPCDSSGGGSSGGGSSGGCTCPNGTIVKNSQDVNSCPSGYKVKSFSACDGAHGTGYCLECEYCPYGKC